MPIQLIAVTPLSWNVDEHCPSVLSWDPPTTHNHNGALQAQGERHVVTVGAIAWRRSNSLSSSLLPLQEPLATTVAVDHQVAPPRTGCFAGLFGASGKHSAMVKEDSAAECVVLKGPLTTEGLASEKMLTKSSEVVGGELVGGGPGSTHLAGKWRRTTIFTGWNLACAGDDA